MCYNRHPHIVADALAHEQSKDRSRYQHETAIASDSRFAEQAATIKTVGYVLHI